jgi:hypothetical protein
MLRCKSAMVKQTKSQHLREKMRTDIKYSKQTTLGNVPKQHKAEPPNANMKELKKQIEITEIASSTREDELVLKVAFKLTPSRTVFSKVTSDLYFDEQKIDSLRLRVLQGPLATDESEFSAVLDMTGISEGKHALRVEMYELWDSGERLYSTSKEESVDYVPVKREDRLIRVPILKKAEGTGLDIVSDTDKNIYREIEEEMKKESENRRDYW